MQIFHFLFSAQSSHTCLPVELNAQIIEVSMGGHGEEAMAGPCSHPLPCHRRCMTICPARAICSLR